MFAVYMLPYRLSTQDTHARKTCGGVWARETAHLSKFKKLVANMEIISQGRPAQFTDVCTETMHPPQSSWIIWQVEPRDENGQKWSVKVFHFHFYIFSIGNKTDTILSEDENNMILSEMKTASKRLWKRKYMIKDINNDRNLSKWYFKKW